MTTNVSIVVGLVFKSTGPSGNVWLIKEINKEGYATLKCLFSANDSCSNELDGQHVTVIAEVISRGRAEVVHVPD